MKVLSLSLLCIMSFYSFSQNQPKNPNGFLIKLGANYVDNSGDSNPFKFLTSFKKGAFSQPLKLGVEYRFSDLFSVGVDGSINKWKAPDAVIDLEKITEDQDYFSLDTKLNLYVDEVFNWFSNADWLDLYLDVGVGYFKINEGGLSGNFGGGTNIWLSQKIGLNLTAVSKWTLDETPAKYDTNHLQFSAAVIFKLSNGTKKQALDELNDNTLKVNSESKDVVKDAYAQAAPEIDNNKDVAPNQIESNTEKIDNSENDFDDVAANYILNLSRKIKFKVGNYNFTQESYEDLNRILLRLLEYPNIKLRIEGHADSVGEFNDNEILSKKRANTVKNYLVAGGVNPNNLIVIGKGELYPITSNLTKEGRQKNRRVEIVRID
ncbi:OmpA family protein [Flavivirga aquimarina]|uniref:OmpA family protein n=1 Tax=Flavivirga aquimarina TaxID=2027862 RepID=A0ABT8W702_9FLAO|nr:OmpA family protein [Flavivirga aquimarina]MDO5968898.1 OmpA family protein [Flavivirga aquimarina]